MPKQAYRVETDGTLTLVDASELTKKDYFSYYICPGCHRPLHLRCVDSKFTEAHFYGAHASDCKCAIMSTKKISNHEYAYRPDLAANFIDKETTVKAVIDSEINSGEAVAAETVVDKDDYREVEVAEVIDNVRKAYALAKEEPEVYKTFGVDLNNMFFTPQTSSYFHDHSISGQVMVELKKCSPGSLNPPLHKDDYYLYFVEAGAINLRRAIYFKVKLKNINRNVRLWNKIKNMTDDEVIVIWTAKLKYSPVGDYIVYEADNLTSKEIDVVQRYSY